MTVKSVSEHMVEIVRTSQLGLLIVVGAAAAAESHVVHVLGSRRVPES